MKKALFIALLTAGTASFANAQTATKPETPQQEAPKPEKTPEERATDVSNRMTKELGLTPDQKTKIHDLALVRAQKMEALKSKPVTDKRAREAEKKQIMNDFDAGVKNVLTPDQYTKWQAKKAEQKEERKEKRNPPPPPAGK